MIYISKTALGLLMAASLCLLSTTQASASVNDFRSVCPSTGMLQDLAFSYVDTGPVDDQPSVQSARFTVVTPTGKLFRVDPPLKFYHVKNREEVISLLKFGLDTVSFHGGKVERTAHQNGKLTCFYSMTDGMAGSSTFTLTTFDMRDQ